MESIKRLGATSLPTSVEILDVGIGGCDFVLKLMAGCEEAIVIDAVQRGEPPGTLSVFTPSTADLRLQEGERLDPHGLSRPRL